MPIPSISPNPTYTTLARPTPSLPNPHIQDKATLLALLCRSCCEDCVFLLDAGGANVGCSVISSSTFGRRKGDGDGVLGDGGKALKGQEVGSRVEGRGRGSGRVGFLEDLKSLRALVTAGRYGQDFVCLFLQPLTFTLNYKNYINSYIFNYLY